MSDEKHETIMDIEADLRKRAEALENALGDQHSYVEFYRGLADRIKAAYGHEVAELRRRAESAELDAALWAGSAKAAEEKLRELRSATLGNAAKMRKAVCDLMDEYVHRKCPPEKNCEGCERKCGINDAWLAVSAALAAPPRNCDKYATLEKAEEAYENQSGSLEDGHAFGWWLLNAEGEATGEVRR